MLEQKQVTPIVATMGAPFGNISFNTKIPEFSESVQDKSERVDPITGKPIEHYWNNHFTNWFGKKMSSPSYPGRREVGLEYPGTSGQGQGGYNNTGVWTPNATTHQSFVDDIQHMFDTFWIDAQTSQVTASCAILEPSYGLVLYFFYSVEFLPSGRLMPSFPYITVDYWDRWDDTQGFLPLFVAFIFGGGEVPLMALCSLPCAKNES